MLPTEAIPAAVPVQKTSSASFISSTGTTRSSTCYITHFSRIAKEFENVETEYNRAEDTLFLGIQVTLPYNQDQGQFR